MSRVKKIQGTNPSELGAGANHREQLTGQRAANKKAVLWLTGITHQQWQDFLFATMADWIDWMLPCIPGKRQASYRLLEGEMILKWWAFNWHNADDSWILSELYHAAPGDAYLAYRRLHQYVFDPKHEHFKYLTEDFNTLLPDFEKEVASTPAPGDNKKGGGK